MTEKAMAGNQAQNRNASRDTPLRINMRVEMQLCTTVWIVFLQFEYNQTGFIGFTRVQMRCVTTVSTLTLTPYLYLFAVLWSECNPRVRVRVETVIN